jgi:hypothetical protein
VVLLDGHGTMRPPAVAETMADVRHELEPDWDFAAATAPYAGDAATGRGPAYHTRAVLYAHAGYWIVADRILTAGGPRQVQALWHFFPDCTVRAEGNLVYTEDAGKGNFGMLAVTGPKSGWDVELVHGREEPTPQGWYSPEFNVRLAATCAEFTGVAAGPGTYVWVMWTVPAGKSVMAGKPEATVQEASAAAVLVELKWPDGKVDEAVVPWVKEQKVAWVRKP